MTTDHSDIFNFYSKTTIPDNKRVLVCGDIHGKYRKFMNMLDKKQFDPANDIVLCTGDLADRGEDSPRCLDLINEDWFLSVQGNHDTYGWEYLGEQHSAKKSLLSENWRNERTGGNWFFELNKNQRRNVARQFLRVMNIPFVREITYRGKKIVICHADYPSNDYGFNKKVNPMIMIYNRNRIRPEFGEPQDTTVISGADLFIHGHTTVRTPILLGNRWYVDTGCGKSGKLTMIELDTLLNEYAMRAKASERYYNLRRLNREALRK